MTSCVGTCRFSLVRRAPGFKGGSTLTGTRAAAGMRTEARVPLNSFSKSPRTRDARGSAIGLFFYESLRKNYDALKPVVDEYKARGVQAEGIPCGGHHWPRRGLDNAQGLPLFLFLDPCGVGIPFSDLTGVLSGPRRDTWPPTEVLLNFSLEAVRRIAGHVTSENANEKTMETLDSALGGDWWRDIIRKYGVTDDAVSEIVDGFVGRLCDATNMHIYAIPVRRAPHHKPVYYLVFGGRSSLGIWYFADSAARATETWWAGLEAKEAAGMKPRVLCLYSTTSSLASGYQGGRGRGAASYRREYRCVG